MLAVDRPAPAPVVPITGHLADLDRYLAWMEAEKRSENSLMAYRSDLLQLRAFLIEAGLGDFRWRDVPAELLRAFVASLGVSHRPASIARKVGVIRSFYGWSHAGAVGAVLLGHEAPWSNPAAELHGPAVAFVPNVLSAEDVDKLEATVAEGTGTHLGMRDAAMVALVRGTGIRASELVGLNTVDFGMPKNVGWLRVLPRRHGKCDWLVEIPDAAFVLLEAYVERSRPVLTAGHDRTPALFVNHRGGRLTRQGWWLILGNYAAAAGLKVAPSALRHAFAAGLLREGKSVREVQRRLGHANPQTTQKYGAVVTA